MATEGRVSSPCEKYPHGGCGCPLDDGTPLRSGRVPSRTQQPCTCPWGWREGGYVTGIASTPANFGRERVRLSTTTGCPEHDACHGYTLGAFVQDAHGIRPWCPTHEAKGCPDA